MGHIYFVRHGESVWNVENKICGVTDSPLSKRGHAQAIETGKAFVEQGLTADEILYSPLQRAADTAKHISEMTGIPTRMEPRLVAHNGIARVIQSYFTEMNNEEYAAFGIRNCQICRFDFR